MMYRLAKFLVDALAPAFGLILSLWLIYNIETRFFPVVENFRVTSLAHTGGVYVANGELTKNRNCEFIGLTIYASRQGSAKLLLGQFKKDIFGSDVGTGHQTWGPWSISLPPKVVEYDVIEVQGTHRCHALWLQTTEYLTLDLKGLPQ